MTPIGYWRRGSGELVSIKSMATSHLINAMAYIWRTTTQEQYNEGSRKPYRCPQALLHELGAELQTRMDAQCRFVEGFEDAPL